MSHQGLEIRWMWERSADGCSSGGIFKVSLASVDESGPLCTAQLCPARLCPQGSSGKLHFTTFLGFRVFEEAPATWNLGNLKGKELRIEEKENAKPTKYKYKSPSSNHRPPPHPIPSHTLQSPFKWTSSLILVNKFLQRKWGKQQSLQSYPSRITCLHPIFVSQRIVIINKNQCSRQKGASIMFLLSRRFFFSVLCLSALVEFFFFFTL